VGHASNCFMCNGCEQSRVLSVTLDYTDLGMCVLLLSCVCGSCVRLLYECNGCQQSRVLSVAPGYIGLGTCVILLYCVCGCMWGMRLIAV